MELFGPTIQKLEKALALRTVNHRVIASNIANVDTPGFQANRLDFEMSIQMAIDEIDAASATPELSPDYAQQAYASALGQGTEVEAVIEPTGEVAITLDGNNVNLEAQLGDLTQNSMMYQLTARLLAFKFGQLRAALDQSGG